ncbi:MAG: hypothetical protein KGR26_06755 [Cyanobacteria bacterium REEB65]|nr:hypothetical protein [Cyanobacteria bacterium REEB65]
MNKTLVGACAFGAAVLAGLPAQAHWETVTVPEYGWVTTSVATSSQVVGSRILPAGASGMSSGGGAGGGQALLISGQEGTGGRGTSARQTSLKETLRLSSALQAHSEGKAAEVSGIDWQAYQGTSYWASGNRIAFVFRVDASDLVVCPVDGSRHFSLSAASPLKLSHYTMAVPVSWEGHGASAQFASLSGGVLRGSFSNAMTGLTTTNLRFAGKPGQNAQPEARELHRDHWNDNHSEGEGDR